MALAVPPKRERLEARITPEQKEMLERAAALEGTSLTDFVLHSAQQAAEHVIRDREHLLLDMQASAAFVDVLLNPPVPNPALRAAAQQYRQVMGSD